AGTVAIAFGLAASSIFPCLMMGIFSKTMNKQGAIWGMLAGIGVTMFYVFAHKGIFFIKGTEFLGLFGGKSSFFFGISPNAFGAIGAVVNFAVAFAVKNMTPPVPEEIAQMVEDVRIPRGSKAVDGAH
ncbi:MAG: cation acetate symporter, partial [Desulfuromusa sp.]|nr:cation acetate symporter [Desulfuromusa sp.]